MRRAGAGAVEHPPVDPTEKIELGEFLELQQVDWTLPDEVKREKILHELRTTGFLLITNVPGHDEERLMHWGKWLCGLSKEEKGRLTKRYWNKENKNVYRGLAPFIDNDPSHVEIYDMGLDFDKVTPPEQEYILHEETPWPTWSEEGREFTAFMKDQYELRCRVAREILMHIAIAFKLDPQFFDKFYDRDTLSTFSVNHYCPRDRGITKNDEIKGEQYYITIAQHTDTGFVTLLATLGYPGLQIHKDGRFQSVKPMPGAFVINIGDMLSRMTNYQLRSTLHRVIDIGTDRYSSPFFFEPFYEAKIPSSIIKNEDGTLRELSEEQKKFDNAMYGDYMIDKVLAYCLSYSGIKKGKKMDQNIDEPEPKDRPPLACSLLTEY
jgi:isopenicillin N synthase-like dioxygenase